MLAATARRLDYWTKHGIEALPEWALSPKALRLRDRLRVEAKRKRACGWSGDGKPRRHAQNPYWLCAKDLSWTPLPTKPKYCPGCGRRT